MRSLIVSIYLLVSASCFAQNHELPVQAKVETQTPQSQEQVNLSYAKLVKKVAPAVVNIYASQEIQDRSVSPLLDDPFFSQFFGEDFLSQGSPTRVEKALGSGVLVRQDGIVITNFHVIKNADQIKVVLEDGREFDAEIVAKESRTDLAALKLKEAPENLPHLQLIDVDELEVGDLVLAIGNPFGLGQTVTSGIISALARTQLGVSDFRSFIQTDAAINPGNSGGALVTIDGHLAGINTAILSRSGGSIGIGFAIPANLVIPLIESVNYGGKILRPWIGAVTQDIDAHLAQGYGLDRPRGAIVTGVYPESPAAKAGIEVGDLIYKFDDKEIINSSTYKFREASRTLTHVAHLTLIKKNGEKIEKEVKMEAPPEAGDKRQITLRGRHPLVGATVTNLSPALAIQLGIDFLESGVLIIRVEPDSIAKRLGLAPGDIIKQVNEQPVGNIDGLAQRLTRARPVLFKSERISWKIEIKRDNRTYNIILQ